MNQIGDLKQFTLTVGPGTGIYSYVWKFWDGSTDATTGTSTTKVVNIGGNPDSNELHYSCTPVAIDGQEVTVYGTFQANNPPQIVPSPTISLNDIYLPFTTRLGVYAFDIEGDPLTFDWFSGTVLLGSGTTGGTISVNGTWQGNGILDVRSYTAHENYQYINVFSDRTVSCQIYDASSGTTEISFDLRGFDRPASPTGIIVTSPSVFSSIRALPIQRISSGAYFDFQVIAKDVVNGPIVFNWNFAGSNNWTAVENGAGTNTLQPDGSYQSVYRKYIENEVVLVGTQKTVRGDCSVLSQTSQTDVNIDVVLIANTGPSAVTIAVRDAVTQAVFSDLTQVPKESVLQYDATVVDDNNDVTSVNWALTLSVPGAAAPGTYASLGPKIIVTPQSVFNDGTTATAGCRITGSVEVFDRLNGGPLIQVVPTVTLV